MDGMIMGKERTYVSHRGGVDNNGDKMNGEEEEEEDVGRRYSHSPSLQLPVNFAGIITRVVMKFTHLTSCRREQCFSVFARHTFGSVICLCAKYCLAIPHLAGWMKRMAAFYCPLSFFLLSQSLRRRRRFSSCTWCRINGFSGSGEMGRRTATFRRWHEV